MSGRRCPSCGAGMASDNGDARCGPCMRTAIDRELLTDQNLSAKGVVDVYAHPERFKDERDYLGELSLALDVLCRSHGVKPPHDFIEVFEIVQISEGVESSRSLGKSAGYDEASSGSAREGAAA